MVVLPRALLLIDSLQVNGPARTVVTSAVGLQERGMQVRVAHLGIGPGEQHEGELRGRGIPVLNLELGSLLNPSIALKLVRYIRRENVDLVHTHNRYAHLIGRPAALAAGRPVVSTIHNIVEDRCGWRESVRRRMDYLTARWCNLIVTVSEAQRQAYLRQAGVSAGKVERHPNGVDTSVFRPDPLARARVRRELDVADNTPLVVSVGALREGKGYAHLIAAARRVLAVVPDVRFVIAGDGPCRRALAAIAEPLASSVRLLGERADVPALLAAADVYVQPSLYEAWPTSVLEAMAVGLPVLGTRVGGIPELIIDGRTGVLVPPGQPDQIATQLGRLLDPHRRGAIGAAARAWILANAGLEAWLDDLIDVYARVSSGVSTRFAYG